MSQIFNANVGAFQHPLYLLNKLQHYANMDSTHIKDLKVGVKNLNLIFIVLDVSRPSTTKEGHEIRTCRVADSSGAIHLSVWDKIGTYIQPGDILRLTKGYVALWKNVPTLYMGKGGELLKTGEFTLIFSETPNMSDPAQNQQATQNLNPTTNQIKQESENLSTITPAD